MHLYTWIQSERQQKPATENIYEYWAFTIITVELTQVNVILKLKKLLKQGSCEKQQFERYAMTQKAVLSSSESALT